MFGALRACIPDVPCLIANVANKICTAAVFISVSTYATFATGKWFPVTIQFPEWVDLLGGLIEMAFEYPIHAFLYNLALK